MNEITINPGDQFTWNGIECTVIVPYEMSVLCVRTGSSSGKFGVPIKDAQRAAMNKHLASIPHQSKRSQLGSYQQQINKKK